MTKGAPVGGGQTPWRKVQGFEPSVPLKKVDLFRGERGGPGRGSVSGCPERRVLVRTGKERLTHLLESNTPPWQDGAE
jgi:hypothetical protein